ncbi:MAG: hypothetical protein GY757_18520 [bacterium]|nr:hypothetical protein [bacterium]
MPQLQFLLFTFSVLLFTFSFFSLSFCAKAQTFGLRESPTLSTTLESFLSARLNRMPGKGEGYRAPTGEQLSELGTIMKQMLKRKRNIIIPAVLAGVMEIRKLKDTDNKRTYTVLYETGDSDGDGTVDMGFGTFIVYGKAKKELNIAIAHPLFETGTARQGIRIFKRVSARSFLMAGVHRNALTGEGTCQRRYPDSDAAHNNTGMFFEATVRLKRHYRRSRWYQLQFHGFSIDSCPGVDVNVSHGNFRLSPPEGDILYVLQNNLSRRHPGWKIRIDGEGCNIDGGRNTSGRLLNGVPKNLVCKKAATRLNETFIHIEQVPGKRSAADWVDAINETFPKKSKK